MTEPDVLDEIEEYLDEPENPGEVELTFPWVGGKVEARWPASEKTVMVSIIALALALALIIPSSLYIIFVSAQAENIAEVRQSFTSKPVPTANVTSKLAPAQGEEP